MSDTSMRAEEVILNNGSQWQLFEQFINPTEKRILVINILLQFQGTLIPKTHSFVDLSVLV